MQFQMWVHARPPRVECPNHGVLQVNVPWAEEGSRFTKFFERFAIDVSQETDTKGASKILRLSWDEASNIQERALTSAHGFNRGRMSAFGSRGVPSASALEIRRPGLSAVLETGALAAVRGPPSLRQELGEPLQR